MLTDLRQEAHYYGLELHPDKTKIQTNLTPFMHSELINKLFDVKDKLSDAEYKSLVDCIAECESKKTSTEYYELHYL